MAYDCSNPHFPNSSTDETLSFFGPLSASEEEWDLSSNSRGSNILLYLSGLALISDPKKGTMRTLLSTVTIVFTTVA